MGIRKINKNEEGKENSLKSITKKMIGKTFNIID